MHAGQQYQHDCHYDSADISSSPPSDISALLVMALGSIPPVVVTIIRQINNVVRITRELVEKDNSEEKMSHFSPIEFKTVDGHTLRGCLYSAAQRGPAIIMTPGVSLESASTLLSRRPEPDVW